MGVPLLPLCQEVYGEVVLEYGVRCKVPELRVREFDQGARPHGAYVLYNVGDFTHSFNSLENALLFKIFKGKFFDTLYTLLESLTPETNPGKSIGFGVTLILSNKVIVPEFMAPLEGLL